MLSSALAVGLRTLAANPLRTFLATLGVIIGTAALVAVLALGDGVERYAREQIASRTDLQLFSITPQTRRRLDGIWLPRTDTVRLGAAELASLEQELGPEVALTLRLAGGTLVGGLPGDSLRGAMVEALLGDVAAPSDSVLVAGRVLTPAEAAGEAALAVVTPDLAALVGPDSTALGRSLLLHGVPFTVIGIAGTPGTEEKVLAIRVPFGAFHSAVPPELQGPAAIVGSAKTLEEMEPAVARATAWAKRVGGDDGLAVGSRGEILAEVSRGMLVARLLMGSITGISLLVGGIGIMNVLLASVVERTREIGIRRATGARRRDIIGQFLAESVVITSAGSVLGVVLGMLGAFGVSWLMRAQSDAPVHAAFTPVPLVVAASSAVVIGLVFGTYPALKAARLAPIDAIRTE